MSSVADRPPVYDIAAHVEALRVPQDIGTVSKLDEEWEELELEHTRMRADPSMWITARHPDNICKNRYMDILPNEDTRVKLQIKDPMESDYINGNWIDGKAFELPHLNYISAQAPTARTIDDFWRMIWECDVALILMLTKEAERAKVKCVRYWPPVPTAEVPDPEEVFGDIAVRWLEPGLEAGCEPRDTPSGEVVRRRLVIRRGRARRVVMQLQHTQWPDHGVPEQGGGFREVLHATDAWLAERYGPLVRRPPGNTDVAPILVHCSAGVGRTGCFIAIHVLLNKYREHRAQAEAGAETVPCDLDCLRTVLQLRQHRAAMVQSVEQLLFIYETLAGEVDRVDKEGPTPAPPEPGAAAAR